MLNVPYRPRFLISPLDHASLECGAVWASSHMRTYDRINLAECSLATRVRLYRPAPSRFQSSALTGWSGTASPCTHWSADNMGGRGEVDVEGKGHSLSICYPVSNAARVCSCIWQRAFPPSPCLRLLLIDSHTPHNIPDSACRYCKWGNSTSPGVWRDFQHWIT